jgi:uncharacterized protein
MCNSQIPDKELDLFELAKQGRQYQAKVAIEQLQRFSPMLIDTAGDVDVLLNLYVVPTGTYVLAGQLVCRATARCQRCLHGMVIPLHCDFQLALVATEEQAALIEQSYEPLVLDNGMVSLLQIVEDELILSMPVIVMHPQQECAIDTKYQAKVSKTQDNPFAVLSSLKKNNKT